LIQFCLGMAFSTELAIRITQRRKAFFVGPGLVWNYFDSFITVFSVINALVELSAGGSLGHFSFLRVFRVLRVLRAAHLFRNLQEFYMCQLILDCLTHALVPAFWVFTMLLFVLYVWAVVLQQLLEFYVKNQPTLDVEVVRLYGGLGNSIFTLYLSISGGADWHELLDPLLAISGSFQAFFMFFAGFMHFGMLNILSAIFVSFVTTFVNRLQQERVHDMWAADSAVIEELRQIMSKENSREDGRISRKRLKQILETRGEMHLNKVGLDVSAAVGVFNMLDADNVGTVPVDELACGLLQLKGNTESVHFATVMYENKRLISRINKLSQNMQSEFHDLKQSKTSQLV